MNTFLARTGSNSRVDACFLAIKQSLPCGCVRWLHTWKTSSLQSCPNFKLSSIFQYSL